MHHFTKMIIVSLCFLMSGWFVYSPSPKELTVKLVCKNSFDMVLGWGSGTLIGDNYVLSAAHVARGCSEASGNLYIEHKEGGPLSISKIDNKNDLLLLKSDADLGMFRVTIASKDPELTDMLRIWGYPSPNPSLTVSSGIVSSFIHDKFGPLYIVTDAALTFGCSGGGAWDADGNLVGVTSAFVADQGPTDGYRLGLLISASEINSFLMGTAWANDLSWHVI